MADSFPVHSAVTGTQVMEGGSQSRTRTLAEQLLLVFRDGHYKVVELPERVESAGRLKSGLQFDNADGSWTIATTNGVPMAIVQPGTWIGYEISLMRRYQQLARDGASWLIVYAPEDEQAARVAEVAKAQGALAAVKYHRLVVEDII